MFQRWALAVFLLFASNASAQEAPPAASADSARGAPEPTVAGPAVSEPGTATPGSTAVAPASYELDYGAIEGCPSRDEFVASVVERVPSAHQVTRADEADFVVSLSLLPPRSVLTIQKRSGEQETRLLDVDSCLEAARAAALILAVTLDPNTAVHSTRADSFAAPSRGAARDSSTQPFGRGGRESEPPSPQPRRAAPPPASPSGPSRSSWLELGAGASGDLRAGLTPKLLLGGSVLGLAGLGRPAQQSGLEWTPSVMLNMGLTPGSTAYEPDVGSASFSWIGGALSLCLVRIGLTARFGILPCAALDAGRLHAAGKPEPNDIRPLATNVALFAPGARLWARWWLADWADLVVSVGAAWPTRRYRYWLPTASAGPRLLHELGSTTFSANLGLVAVRR